MEDIDPFCRSHCIGCAEGLQMFAPTLATAIVSYSL